MRLLSVFTRMSIASRFRIVRSPFQNGSFIGSGSGYDIRKAWTSVIFILEAPVSDPARWVISIRAESETGVPFQSAVVFRELSIHQPPDISRVLVFQFHRQRGVWKVLETDRAHKTFDGEGADRRESRIGAGRIRPAMLHG